jgi:hypothetical protein
MNVLVGILGFQKKKLRDDQIGRHVIDRADQKNDALLEQTRIDVVSPFAATALLDDHRHQTQRLRIPYVAVVNAHFASFLKVAPATQEASSRASVQATVTALIAGARKSHDQFSKGVHLLPHQFGKGMGLSRTVTPPGPSRPHWPRSPRSRSRQGALAEHSTSGRPLPDGRNFARRPRPAP